MSKERRFIVEIGYRNFAVDQRDVAALLEIANRAVCVTPQGYKEPWKLATGDDEAEPFVTKATLGFVDLSDPAPASDPST